MKSFRVFHESNVPKVAGKTAAEWAQVMGDLRDRKPRPLNKLYGSNGPTPEQKTEWDAKMRAWNSEYRKASKNQKDALELQNRTWKPTMQEDAPVNAAGTGGIAGIGVGPKGEPGVNLKKKKKAEDPLVESADSPVEPESFAGARVFEVGMDQWMKSRFGKNRYHKYAKYVGTDEVGEEIRSFGRTSNDDIVLKDSATAVMTFLRRKSRGNV